MTGSESDSTDEPVVGNVSKFAVVPPGFTGRPKKGHLIFDACFECGRCLYIYISCIYRGGGFPKVEYFFFYLKNKLNISILSFKFNFNNLTVGTLKIFSYQLLI